MVKNIRLSLAKYDDYLYKILKRAARIIEEYSVSETKKSSPLTRKYKTILTHLENLILENKSIPENHMIGL